MKRARWWVSLAVCVVFLVGCGDGDFGEQRQSLELKTATVAITFWHDLNGDGKQDPAELGSKDGCNGVNRVQFRFLAKGEKGSETTCPVKVVDGAGKQVKAPAGFGQVAFVADTFRGFLIPNSQPNTGEIVAWQGKWAAAGTPGARNMVFRDVPAGDYSLLVVLPSGFAFTKANAAKDTEDSDLQPGAFARAKKKGRFTLLEDVIGGPGGDFPGADIDSLRVQPGGGPSSLGVGILAPGALVLRVWNDQNGDGVLDQKEPAAPKTEASTCGSSAKNGPKKGPFILIEDITGGPSGDSPGSDLDLIRIPRGPGTLGSCSEPVRSTESGYLYLDGVPASRRIALQLQLPPKSRITNTQRPKRRSARSLTQGSQILTGNLGVSSIKRTR